MFRYTRPFSKDFLFIFILCAGWVGWRYLRGVPFDSSQASPALYASILWLPLSSVITLYVLYWIDYFAPFKHFKFIPDLLAVWLVLPLAGIVAKPIAGLIFQTEFMRSRDIVFGAFFPALAVTVFEGLAVWAKAGSPTKATLYLALASGENERLLELLQRGGWEKFYRVLTQQEFNGALATGGRVDYIIVSRIGTKNFIEHENILQAQMNGAAILDYRSLDNRLRGHLNLHDTDLWTFLAGSVRQDWLQLVYRTLKFYLEPLAALVLILLLSPFLLFVAILIKVTSPGPVFFSQLRTGYLGRPFYVLKFRSMRTDAEAQGVKWATKADDRVTPVGRFLRKTRIDELPQLWNVLRGEMSFMGPRPERPEFYEIIGREVPAFNLRLLVRPGITGWAQLLGGYAASIEESERKLEYDLYYMQYLSPRMDLIILGRTILTLLKGSSGQ